MESASLPGNLRRTGIEYIKDVPWGTHMACFYGAERDLLGMAVPYFKAGLENNELCLWVTSEPIGAEKAMGALEREIPNFGTRYKRGEITVLPSSEWYTKWGCFNRKAVLGSWIDKLQYALSNGYDGIRVSGDTTWLPRGHWREFITYEATVNKKIPNLNMIALCTYQLGRCGTREIVDVVTNHHLSFVRVDGNLSCDHAVVGLGCPHLAGEGARVAHEIRNPLAAIRGFLQLLLTKDELREYHRYFSLAIREADKIDDLVNQLIESRYDRVCLQGRRAYPNP